MEDFPRYRAGSRLETYLGMPPLSDEAVILLHRLVVAAVDNLQRLDQQLRTQATTAPPVRPLVELARLALDELAHPDAVERIARTAEGRVEPRPA
ncbi:MAG: hypothetical protein NTY19_33920 [Planctomycetota bacterium]|nr:hypothetical protein [Planctomycetota bacterium]